MSQSISIYNYTIFLMLNLFFSFIAATAYGSEKNPYIVPFVTTPVEVDAVLDEDVWKKAVKIDANIEVRPGENIEAPVKTEVYIAYDMTHVYVAFMAYDPDPSQIRAHVCDRDDIWNDDWILILFDTFNDRRQSYDFFCNPYGIQADEIESGDGGGQWDAIWDSDGRITDQGYIVEMAIPFNVLRFQPGKEDQIWSFDAVRSYPRNVRHHIGAFPRDRSNNCYLCQAELLFGFSEAIPGKNIEIDPTFSIGYSQERENETSGPLEEKNKQFDPGLTARWGLATNTTMSVALNPDFSQVEADAAQMDINRQFPLYYNERRPFFLEGVETFHGGGSTDFVHTRSLADPDWGVKLIGKSGKNTIGFFSVRDKVTPLNFPGAESGDNTTLSKQSTGTVLRYKRNILKSSNIGFFLTDREGSNYFNRLAGLDGRIKFTSTDQIRFEIYETSTEYPGEVAEEFEQPSGEFGGTSYNIHYSRNTRKYEFGLDHCSISPDSRVDLGFETQAGYHENELWGGYKWQNDGNHWYTWLSLYSGYEHYTDYNDKLLNRMYWVTFNYNGPLQSYFGFSPGLKKEKYDNKYFDLNVVNFWSGLKPNGSYELNLNGNLGDCIDYDNSNPGKVVSISPSYEQHIGDHLIVEVRHNFQRLTIDEGRLFTANVSNVGLKYQFNKRTFLRTILQYSDYDRNLEYYDDDDVDPVSRNFFTQILFSYKINPQTVFFLGYSDNYGNRNIRDDQNNLDNSLIQKNRAIFTKIGYAWVL